MKVNFINYIMLGVYILLRLNLHCIEVRYFYYPLTTTVISISTNKTISEENENMSIFCA